VLSPYLNFHRPCHFPTEHVDKKGKVRKQYRYQNMMTPHEKLRSLPEAESHLKPGMTLEKLDAIAAQRLNEARTKLFQSINKIQHRAA
jgi:glycogen debranching enzyme